MYIIFCDIFPLLLLLFLFPFLFDDSLWQLLVLTASSFPFVFFFVFLPVWQAITHLTLFLTFFFLFCSIPFSRVSHSFYPFYLICVKEASFPLIIILFPFEIMRTWEVQESEDQEEPEKRRHDRSYVRGIRVQEWEVKGWSVRLMITFGIPFYVLICLITTLLLSFGFTLSLIHISLSWFVWNEAKLVFPPPSQSLGFIDCMSHEKMAIKKERETSWKGTSNMPWTFFGSICSSIFKICIIESWHNMMTWGVQSVSFQERTRIHKVHSLLMSCHVKLNCNMNMITGWSYSLPDRL